MKFEIIKYANFRVQFWLFVLGLAKIVEGLITTLTFGFFHISISLAVAIKVSRTRYKTTIK